MLKNPSAIKHTRKTLSTLASAGTIVCLATPLHPRALAQSATPPAPGTGATNVQTGLSFIASARLKSPDRTFEASTAELRVNLDGTQSVVLKGRTLNVTLDVEPNGFSKAQLVRVSATGSAGVRSPGATFSAGTFSITDNGEHNFLYVEKNKGWMLEVKLRPIEIAKPKTSPAAPSRNSSPTRHWYSRKSKRAPA